jgi:alkanesulfonate monooxygenase SsuD/methylene tetrahydromethanopterin reductase-like flavin-dependent oxidoreductase (luciferase family)
VQRLERAELLGDVQGAAVGQQDAPGADAQVARHGGHVPDEYLGRGDGDRGERVVLCYPEPAEPQLVRMPGEREGVAQRMTRRAAGAPGRLVQDGDRDHARPTMTNGPHVALGLTGGGWHPAAWREPGARPGELLTARWWVDQVREAQAAAMDLVTIEDAHALQSSDPEGPDGRTDAVRGYLDAMVLAARIAPVTDVIGIVPVVSTTLTEPFHVSTQVATIDYVSNGRAGFLAAVSPSHWEAAHAGRRGLPSREVLRAEAAEHVDVVRRLWDSWEDDAEIRDAERHRFVDRDKLHHIDFAGERFRVRGPSIPPRPPQGQPLVLATEDGIGADVVLHNVVVFLDADEAAAAERRARLDALHPFAPAAQVVTGTPAQLADLVTELRNVRLLPAAIPHDLEAITRGLVPELRARGLHPRAYGAGTLRERWGLGRPASRYAA